MSATTAPDWMHSSQHLRMSLCEMSDAELAQERTTYAIELESPYSPTHRAMVKADLELVRAEIERRAARHG